MLGTESASAVTFGRGYLRDLVQFSADATLSSEQNEQLEHKAKSRTRCLVELLDTFPCCPHKGLSE